MKRGGSGWTLLHNAIVRDVKQDADIIRCDFEIRWEECKTISQKNGTD